jgi:cytochrome b subunit of formate dehydrogenase
MTSDSNIKVYEAWDINTRLFHWIHVLCILTLSILGLIMLSGSKHLPPQPQDL